MADDQEINVTLVAGARGTELLDELRTSVRRFPVWWLLTGDHAMFGERVERNKSQKQKLHPN